MNKNHTPVYEDRIDLYEEGDGTRRQERTGTDLGGQRTASKKVSTPTLLPHTGRRPGTARVKIKLLTG